MNVVRIEFNSDGFAALLKDSSMRELIDSYTNDIKARADAYLTEDSRGFNANTKMFDRWVGLVGTTDLATIIAESEQKALTKAVNG